jgi:GH35 family endo-1,4-beta-xylanase
MILDAITEIYTQSNIGDSLDKCLLNNLANNLIPEKRSEFYNRVKELKSKDFKKIEITKDKFNPKAMFPFE